MKVQRSVLLLFALSMLLPQISMAKTKKMAAKKNASSEASSDASDTKTAWGIRGDLGYGASQNSGEVSYLSGGSAVYVPFAPSAGFPFGVEATYEFSKYIEFSAGFFPEFAGYSYAVPGGTISSSTFYTPLIINVYGRLPLIEHLNLLLAYGIGVVPGTQTHTVTPVAAYDTQLNMGTAYRSFVGAEYWLNSSMSLIAGLQDLTMDNTATTVGTPLAPSRTTNYTVDFNQIAFVVGYGYRF